MSVTLAEFLLARIAEDEAEARSNDDPRYYPEGWHPNHVARVLAECEAKRRIMERHSSCDDVSYGDASTCPDLLDLTAVYADHPDYRDEWRP